MGVMVRKKALLLLFALLLCAGSAVALTGAYMGLYTDNAHSNWCASGPGFYPVEMWIWCLPGDQGAIANEFRISYPYNVQQLATNWQWPIIYNIIGGDLSTGISIQYISCQTDWFWLCRVTLMVTDPTQTHLAIVGHPDTGVYRIWNCQPGYPWETVNVLTNLYINYTYDEPLCQGTATDEASWGAIKSIMNAGGD